MLLNGDHAILFDAFVLKRNHLHATRIAQHVYSMIRFEADVIQALRTTIRSACKKPAQLAVGCEGVPRYWATVFMSRRVWMC